MATQSWHRNPWVWLLIAIPTATVIGCLITIYLAISNPHTMVDDSTSSLGVAHGIASNRPA